MTDLARTPEPPYYAVIFTSRRAAEYAMSLSAGPNLHSGVTVAASLRF